jgi:hypothetical protein
MQSGIWLDIYALRFALFPSLMPLLLTWGILIEQTERTVFNPLSSNTPIPYL